MVAPTPCTTTKLSYSMPGCRDSRTVGSKLSILLVRILSYGREIAEGVQWRNLFKRADGNLFTTTLYRSCWYAPTASRLSDSSRLRIPVKRLALGVKLFEKREYDSAEEETKRAITMLPGSSFACHMLADIFRNTGRTGQGESQERKCKKCFPTR